MDAGVEKCGYYSIEEAIENNVAPVPLSMDPTVDVQRVIDVIDHLFSCEVLKAVLFSLNVFRTIETSAFI